MPYLRTHDPRRRLTQRNHKRSVKHGKDWRQVYIDCAGMCVYPECDLGDGYWMPCGEVTYLEFHAEWGEQEGKFPGFRKLVCPYHHGMLHTHARPADAPHNPSILAEDIELEMYLCGGYDNWVKKFNLIDRFGCELPNVKGGVNGWILATEEVDCAED